jgi:hypothetical protein
MALSFLSIFRQQGFHDLVLMESALQDVRNQSRIAVCTSRTTLSSDVSNRSLAGHPRLVSVKARVSAVVSIDRKRTLRQFYTHLSSLLRS